MNARVARHSSAGETQSSVQSREHKVVTEAEGGNSREMGHRGEKARA